jgi:hypothetical protein
MRRQSRRFIVEVKKKRGEITRQRSIWGKLDLAAIGAETARELAEGEPLAAPVTAIDVVLRPDHTLPSTPVPELPVSEVIQSAGPSDVEAEPAAIEMVGQPKPVSRKRRKGGNTLPRGERWKRRLPKALRTASKLPAQRKRDVVPESSG